MITKIRRRLAQEEGFTLIELLVVILIIGILAAVAIPTFLSQKNKATDSNAQSNLKNAQTVVESYADGNGGSYPNASGAGIATPTLITSVAGLSGDTDANSLGSGTAAVYYENTSTANPDSADTYALAAEGDTSNPTYWAIVVNNGQTYYGVEQGTSGSAGAALAIAHAVAAESGTTSTGSSSGFPSVTS